MDKTIKLIENKLNLPESKNKLDDKEMNNLNNRLNLITKYMDENIKTNLELNARIEFLENDIVLLKKQNHSGGKLKLKICKRTKKKK